MYLYNEMAYFVQKIYRYPKNTEKYVIFERPSTYNTFEIGRKDFIRLICRYEIIRFKVPLF